MRITVCNLTSSVLVLPPPLSLTLTKTQRRVVTIKDKDWGDIQRSDAYQRLQRNRKLALIEGDGSETDLPTPEATRRVDKHAVNKSRLNLARKEDADKRAEAKKIDQETRAANKMAAEGPSADEVRAKASAEDTKAAEKDAELEAATMAADDAKAEKDAEDAEKDAEDAEKDAEDAEKDAELEVATMAANDAKAEEEAAEKDADAPNEEPTPAASEPDTNPEPTPVKAPVVKKKKKVVHKKKKKVASKKKKVASKKTTSEE